MGSVLLKFHREICEMTAAGNQDASAVEGAVRTNLVHLQGWRDVEVQREGFMWHGRLLRLLCGHRPASVASPEGEASSDIEYILPVSLAQHSAEPVTIECLDRIFAELCGPDTSRILVAIVSDDGTIVFYFLHKGIHKPKKN